ncbi:MAG: SDR family oxidoreductase [Armatimonadota bacterium]|nr:SDR family oxidoreductase [Armatimonadota bacterium]MDR7428105.1 SDR family oxidoreductase [Armatimonadota bacterium]MDR7464458.1 SDR family oxidoreductase [Armatimonadota bacterium]MDR7470508.1 SDR family oxidoreductase [Armatimonadota bacterium]MDR7475480.1 SDR family oxidoreductase [Armatimonadota bacterium]
MSTRTDERVPVSLRGKVLLVTGARRGIGLAIAARAAQAGAEVIVHAREQAQAEAAARQIAGATAVWGDLSTVEGVRAVITAAGETTGRLDGLVNNAGLAVVQPAEAFSAEDWERQFAVNVRATFFACQAALPYLRRGSDPAIVNISSLHAQTAVPGRAVYAASKAAVDHLTRTLAVEWARWRIRVNAVAPGFVRTEQVAHLLAREGTRIEARTPLGRVAEPDDVAAAVCFLLSAAARHITGTVLPVDGGYLLYGGWEMPQAAQGT